MKAIGKNERRADARKLLYVVGVAMIPLSLRVQ